MLDPRKLTEGEWFSGAKFLYEDEDSWPQTIVDELNDNDVEIKKKSLLVSFVSVIKAEVISNCNWNFTNWISVQ